MSGPKEDCALLRAPGVAAAVLGSAPAWVWDVGAGRIRLASAAGIAFFAAPDAASLYAREFSMGAASMAQLARLPASLPRDGTGRLSLLRFFVGTQALPVACICTALTDVGREAVLVVAGSGATEHDLAARFAASLGSLETPLVLSGPAGEIARNAAAGTGPLAGTTEAIAVALPEGAVSLTVEIEPKPDEIPEPAPEPAPKPEPAPPPAAHEPVAAVPVDEPPAAEAPPETLPPIVAKPVDAERIRIRRFTFQLDPDGRFAEIGVGLPTLLGEEAADVIGLSLADLALIYGSDPDGRIGAALETRNAWRGLEMSWPTDFGDLVRLRLSALPRFGTGRDFEGFRGFADILSIEPFAATAKPEAEDEEDWSWLEEEAGIEPATTAEPPAGPTPEPKAGEPEPETGEPPAETTEPEPEPRPAAVSTVSDVMFVEPAEAAPPPTPAAREEAAGERPRILRLHPRRPVPVEAGKLNDQERTAFKAIADALGARWDRQPEAAPEPTEAGESAAAEDAAPEPAAETEAPPPAAEAPAPEAPAPEAPALESEPGAEVPAAPSHELVLEVFDRVPLGLAILRDRKILAANRAFLELFGYPDLDDLEIAGGLGALLEGRDEDADAEAGTAVTARRRDGTTFKVEARLGRTPWIDGPAMLMSVREASNGAAIGVAPAEAKELPAPDLRAVLDAALDGVLVLSPEANVIWASDGAGRLFDAPPELLKDRPLADLVAPGDRAKVAELIAGLGQAEVPSLAGEGHEIAILKGARKVPAELVLSQLEAGEGEDGKRICALLRDLTEWKKTEEELVSARKRAEDASDKKSDFLAKMSHEIRTPLNGIIGFSEVILEERFGPLGNERYREYMKDIRQSGEHLMSLVNDLLDLSKVEAGKLEMNFTGVRLNDLVEQAMAVMQPQSNRARVIIRSSLRNNLPAVVADARSIRQVLLNILSNAIKFTPPGGQVIVSTALADNGEVILRIRDTGVGMSASDVATAMEPFRQLNTTPSTGERGTGLGLPLAKALTEANRASFGLTSKVGEGTLVEITFPQPRVLAE